MIVAAGESSTQAWVVIVLAIIGACGGIGAAWAANTARRTSVTNSTKIDTMTGANTTQHERVGVSIADIAQRQQWVIDQLAEIRQALLDHVIWEQGGAASPHAGGKYHDLERHLAAIEAELRAPQHVDGARDE